MAGRAATSGGTSPLLEVERRAHELAQRMPELMVEARRVANTIAHGIHGRRRAGPGETFWQFRHVQPGDPVNMIDWRRSASSDHLYLREREWEAAHTVWLWPDLSPSMDFQSHISPVRKMDRALVLMMALGELLIAGGERIGLLGSMPATGSRNAMEKVARIVLETLERNETKASLPPALRLSRFNGLILIGDFLDPTPEVSERIAEIAASGITAHMVQVLDPAEETLPYQGRVEFVANEDGERVLVNRSETLRGGYAARMAAHKAALADLARRFEWTYLAHHTDKPAETALLALHTRLSGRNAGHLTGTGARSTSEVRP